MIWLRPAVPGALFCAVILVAVMIVTAVNSLGSNPFQWVATGLGPLSLIGFFRPLVCRETGMLLARSGIVLALLTGQLEFGSGRLYWNKGAAWLLVGFIFALVVLLLHLAGHVQRMQEERDAQEARNRAKVAEVAWREELLAAVKRPAWSAPWPLAVALIALVLLRRRR